MYIFVKTLSGVSCEVANVDNLEDLQSGIANQMGVPSSEQTLLFNGKRLTLDSLEESGLVDNCTVSLIVDLQGGAKGKKKKKEVKKSKKKHHKKKLKLEILKYYKIEGDKVVRLKQMCKVCPPGTFIAEHKDRLYCGRCRTAYTKVVEKEEKKGGKEKGGKKEKKGKK